MVRHTPDALIGNTKHADELFIGLFLFIFILLFSCFVLFYFVLFCFVLFCFIN